MKSQYSRRTVVAAINVFEDRLGHQAISAFLLALSSEVDAYVGEGGSIRARLNRLIRMVDEFPSKEVDDGVFEDVIVDKAISLLPEEPEYPWDSAPPPTPAIQVFRRSLEQDGFVVITGGLRRSLPADLALPEAQSELMHLLDRHGLATAKGHLEQALDAHARGKWASANGQLRTFFDALLDELAVRVDPAAGPLGSGQPRRAKLAANGFLSVPLNEWDNDGKGYINGLVRRLHPAGAHPGLSDDDDSTFRLHVVLITAALIVRRFDRLASGS